MRNVPLTHATPHPCLQVLGVLRIVRLTRVLRVLKFSKSLSGIVVLMRTVVKSGSAMVLIATFALLNCVLFASLMMATADVGEYKQDGDYAKQYTSPPSHPALASQPHPSPHRRHIPTPVRRRFQVFARGWINFCFLRDVGVLVVVSADSHLPRLWYALGAAHDPGSDHRDRNCSRRHGARAQTRLRHTPYDPTREGRMVPL